MRFPVVSIRMFGTTQIQRPNHHPQVLACFILASLYILASGLHVSLHVLAFTFQVSIGKCRLVCEYAGEPKTPLVQRNVADKNSK